MSFGWLRRKLGDEWRKAGIVPLFVRTRPLSIPPRWLPSDCRAPTREQHLEALLRMTQSQRMAGQIAGSIAHDFNNCLAIISGSLDLLEHRIGTGLDVPPTNLMQLVVRARDAVQRAADLSAGLHALSHLKSEGTHPVDLGPLVKGLIPLLASVVGRRVRLQATIAPDLPPVAADPGRLKAALVALCLNAREAMTGGGDVVLDLAASTTAEGLFVRVQLVDSGIGIPPEVAARATEPFFTTKDATRVGLGLTEVAAFAQEAGGRLQIEALPEAGTAVSLLLPCAGR